MVFSGGWVVAVARASSNWWQSIACNPERLSTDEVFHLLCCLPLQHLRRISLSLFSFLCLPYPYHTAAVAAGRRHYRIYYYYRSSSSSSADDSDEEDDSHSD